MRVLAMGRLCSVRRCFFSADSSAWFRQVIFRDSCIATCAVGHCRRWSRWPACISGESVSCLNYHFLARPVKVSPKLQNISSTGQNGLSDILPLLHDVCDKIYFTSFLCRSDDVTSGAFFFDRTVISFYKTNSVSDICHLLQMNFFPAWVDIKLNKMKMANQDWGRLTIRRSV
jgi:hypothetical protein